MFNFNCGAKVLPAVVHPTKCCVKHTQENFIVPNIYPSHTTNVNHQVYQQQNYFPHTESFVNEVDYANPVPGMGPMPQGPGPGAGQFSGQFTGQFTPGQGPMGPRPPFGYGR